MMCIEEKEAQNYWLLKLLFHQSHYITSGWVKLSLVLEKNLSRVLFWDDSYSSKFGISVIDLGQFISRFLWFNVWYGVLNNNSNKKKSNLKIYLDKIVFRKHVTNSYTYICEHDKLLPACTIISNLSNWCASNASTEELSS